jgi:phage shock protein PspC (stress-responsive transcriptional regulator)
MERRLHRSRRNKVLLGVCGGLSEYLHIDVVIIRVVSVLALLMGWGLIVYLIAAIIMPEDRDYTPDSTQWGQESSKDAYGSTYSDPGPKTDDTDDFVRDFYNDADNWDRPAKYNSEKNRYVLGAILLGIGVLALGRQFMPSLFQLKFLLPVLLVMIGGIILYQGKK